MRRGNGLPPEENGVYCVNRISLRQKPLGHLAVSDTCNSFSPGGLTTLHLYRLAVTEVATARREGLLLATARRRLAESLGHPLLEVGVRFGDDRRFDLGGLDDSDLLDLRRCGLGLRLLLAEDLAASPLERLLRPLGPDHRRVARCLVLEQHLVLVRGELSGDADGALRGLPAAVLLRLGGRERGEGRLENGALRVVGVEVLDLQGLAPLLEEGEVDGDGDLLGASGGQLLGRLLLGEPLRLREGAEAGVRAGDGAIGHDSPSLSLIQGDNRCSMDCGVLIFRRFHQPVSDHENHYSTSRMICQYIYAILL